MVEPPENPDAGHHSNPKESGIFVLIAIVFMSLMFAVRVSDEKIVQGQMRIMILKDIWGYLLISFSYLGWLMLVAKVKWRLFCIVVFLPALLFAQIEHYSREWRPLEQYREVDGTLHRKIGRSISMFSSDEVETQVVHQGWFYDEHVMTGPIVAD